MTEKLRQRVSYLNDRLQTMDPSNIKRLHDFSETDVKITRNFIHSDAYHSGLFSQFEGYEPFIGVLWKTHNPAE